MSLDDTVKFQVKVYSFHPENSGYDYYDLTEKELMEKCCIFDCNIYWKKYIPVDDKLQLYKQKDGVTLYDIWNYECSEWWEWPANLKKIMHEKVPDSNRGESDSDEDVNIPCIGGECDLCK